MVESNVVALTSSRERTASTTGGYTMLLLLLLAIVVQVYGVVQLANATALSVIDKPRPSTITASGDISHSPIAAALLITADISKICVSSGISLFTEVRRSSYVTPR